MSQALIKDLVFTSGFFDNLCHPQSITHLKCSASSSISCAASKPFLMVDIEVSKKNTTDCALNSESFDKVIESRLLIMSLLALGGL